MSTRWTQWMLTVSTEDQLSFDVRDEVVFTRSGNEFPCAAGEGQRTAPKNVLVEWLRCELYWSVLLPVVAAEVVRRGFVPPVRQRRRFWP